MAKKKLYTVRCVAHNDTFNNSQQGGVSYDEAKKMVKLAKELNKKFKVGTGCHLEVVEFKAPRFGFDRAFAEVAHGPTDGVKIARDGWNGKGLFVQAQYPDENSKMGNPYLYIDATALGGNRNPWIPSQTDLFADDWYVVEIQ